MKNRSLLSVILIAIVLTILPIKVMAANLLSDLQVEGIGSLNLTKSSWNLTLNTSLDYANIIATPAGENVTIEGAGKVNVNEGANTIVVKVTDGTNTENYTINLNVIKSSNSINNCTGVDNNGDPIKNPKTGDIFTNEAIILVIVATMLIAIVVREKKKIFKIN